MIQTLLSRHSIHSLLAMVVSWLLSSVFSVLIDGTWGYDVFMDYAMLVLTFVGAGWVVFVFPFTHFFNNFLKQNRNRLYFPVLSVFYAVLIFSMLFSVLFGLGTTYSMVSSLNILVVTSAMIGGIWGLLYVVMFMAYTRQQYAN